MRMIDVQSQPHLSAAEWQAVTVALRDAERFACVEPRNQREGRLSPWFRALIGVERLRLLADPRLDAVGRFVCASRRIVAV